MTFLQSLILVSDCYQMRFWCYLLLHELGD